MSSLLNTNHKKSVQQKNLSKISLKITVKDERKIMKVFLLERLRRLFCERFYNELRDVRNCFYMEDYEMDNKIIQFLIHSIVETGEYTLEGISHYTRIPFDIIFDAACGKNYNLSITPWAKIVALYIQVKPDISQTIFNKLIEMKEKKDIPFYLLNE